MSASPNGRSSDSSVTGSRRRPQPSPRSDELAQTRPAAPTPGSRIESAISAAGGSPFEVAAPVFDVVRRGFDREQVTEKITGLTAEISGLTEKITALTGQVTNERQRADYAEQELRQAFARINAIERANNHGFGDRMEKLLLIAEQQAAEVTERAEQQAREIVEDARSDAEVQRRDAEAHRREVEQALVSRAAALDQEAARRSAALQRRENDIAASQVAARQQVEEVRATAERDAAAVRERALAEAAELRAQAQAQAAELRAKAQAQAAELRAKGQTEAMAERDRGARELARLIEMQDGVRTEMVRINHVLNNLGAILTKELPSIGGNDAPRLAAVSPGGATGSTEATTTSQSRNSAFTVNGQAGAQDA